MVQMGGQIKTSIIPRSAELILLVLSWSFIFAQSDSLDTSAGRIAEGTRNPHTEDAECSLCHGGAYDRKEAIDQTLCYGCHQLEEYRTKGYQHSLDKGCLACHPQHQRRADLHFLLSRRARHRFQVPLQAGAGSPALYKLSRRSQMKDSLGYRLDDLERLLLVDFL
jgi:hypothetical protein